jgi:hypothetical protein
MKAGAIFFELATLFLLIGTCFCRSGFLSIAWKGGTCQLNNLKMEVKTHSNGQHELFVNNPFDFAVKGM